MNKILPFVGNNETTDETTALQSKREATPEMWKSIYEELLLWSHSSMFPLF
jgi:hypothetical protein